ncbi:MAG: AAA family ATPase [Dehalococcoidia bacterium]|nr:AAA family ATPase [Dehalococcoidia bacterium]
MSESYDIAEAVSDVDDERNAIAACMCENADAVARVRAIIRADHLLRPEHRAIFDGICRVADRGDVVNEITVGEDLARQGRLEEVGGLRYLSDMICRLPFSGAAEHYAKNTVERYVRRGLAQIGSRLTYSAFQFTIPVAEMCEQVTEQLAVLSHVGALGSSRNEPLNWDSFWQTDAQAEEWLVEPLLPRGRQVALFAPAKQGKSLLAFNIASALALGWPILDRPTGKPVRVSYFDLEMTEGDVQERLRDMGIGRHHDLSPLAYHLLPSLPPLTTPAGGAELMRLVKQHEAELVVVDTTSRVIDGPENEADTMRAFYLRTGLPLKAYGATLLRLDHAGKDPSKGQRGTSAKNDDVDLVWELMATQGGIRLRATHRRQAWIPDTVDLLRLTDPLRHVRAAQTWPAGTVEMAALLDELHLPIDVGRVKAREALGAAGKTGRNEVVSAALRYRREATTRPGTAPGTHNSGPEGTAAGDRSTIRFGDSPWDMPGQVPGEPRDTCVSLKGDTCSDGAAATQLQTGRHYA